ncbi:MAG: hypothetical protein HYR72_04650 [Deltaproteobacteria bacterium]|nr:hypothetical protein [Deltaproteobacteria bacterium]MBI3389825.1 hypothetical protein [Deltaproteobacteria bacterium]
MSISGRWTTTMFDRYNITSDDHQCEALRRVHGHLSNQPKTGTVVALHRVSG